MGHARCMKTGRARGLSVGCKMHPVCGMRSPHPPVVRGERKNHHRCRPPRGCRAGSRSMGRGARSPPWVQEVPPPVPVRHRRCVTGHRRPCKKMCRGSCKKPHPPMVRRCKALPRGRSAGCMDTGAEQKLSGRLCHASTQSSWVYMATAFYSGPDMLPHWPNRPFHLLRGSGRSGCSVRLGQQPSLRY